MRRLMRWSWNHRIGIVHEAVPASLALKRPDKPEISTGHRTDDGVAMKLYEISLAESHLEMSDGELARLVRLRLRDEISLRSAILEKGRSEVRKKLGTPIEIDGVRYDSRAQARQALGLNHSQFIRRYGYAVDPQ